MKKYWWQNLNDGPIKKYWIYGRKWFGWGHIEVSAPTQFLQIGFGINGGDSNNDLTINFACRLFAVWLHFKFYQFRVGHWSEFAEKKFFIHEERQFHLAIHDRAIWLLPWGDSMGGWSRSMPWHLVTHSFHPIDFIFGRDKYSEEVIESGNCLIPMPEGCYPATYKLFVSTWKRPRSPFKKQMKRISIDIPGGIPCEGKGENSWDCGEDGIFGQTGVAGNLEQGISSVVESVLSSRKKYGGRHSHRNLNPILSPSREAKS